jgi:preprotein translocase subunit YajC
MQNLNAILFPLLLLAVFWFMLIRPQRRQMQARSRMQSSLQPGDEIVTAGGLLATIRRLDGEIVTIELSPGNEARIDRRYITGKRNPGTDTDDATKSNDDTSGDDTSGDAGEGTGLIGPGKDRDRR